MLIDIYFFIFYKYFSHPRFKNRVKAINRASLLVALTLVSIINIIGLLLQHFTSVCLYGGITGRIVGGLIGIVTLALVYLYFSRGNYGETIAERLNGKHYDTPLNKWLCWSFFLLSFFGLLLLAMYFKNVTFSTMPLK